MLWGGWSYYAYFVPGWYEMIVDANVATGYAGRPWLVIPLREGDHSQSVNAADSLASHSLDEECALHAFTGILGGLLVSRERLRRRHGRHLKLGPPCAASRLGASSCRSAHERRRRALLRLGRALELTAAQLGGAASSSPRTPQHIRSLSSSAPLYSLRSL